MTRRIFAIIPILAFTAIAQPPPTPSKPAELAFEVASIKLAEPMNPAKVASGKFKVGMTVNGNRVEIGYFSLADLIPFAFKVKSYQISGPNWLSAQRFDITAKMPDGATSEQVPEMVQALLLERFKLTFHRETKEHSMYAMVVGKKGSKMKEAEPEPETPSTEAADGGGDGNPPVKPENRPLSMKDDGKGMVITGGGQKGKVRISRGSEGIRIESSRMKMDDLAGALSRFVDRPVVDLTELKGEYQVGLEISMADIMNMARAAGAPIPAGAPGAGEPGKAPSDAASDPSGNSIFESVQQLGLKLEPRKGPIELIVIDHVEKTPVEN